MTTIEPLLARARAATRVLASCSAERRDEVLVAIAATLRDRTRSILAANAEDVESARTAGLSEAMLDRLALDESRLNGVLGAIDQVRALPDPLSELRQLDTRPNGLRVYKRRIPLGVVGVIYEARPNVTVEAATLGIKSGNVMVLRGGREALATNGALAQGISAGLSAAGLPADALVFIADPSRDRVIEMLGAVGRLDLVIPRGGRELMNLVDAHVKVPVIRHGEGICHVYLDSSADPRMSEEVTFNAKVHRPGVCNAAETLLVHRDLVASGTLVSVARRLVSDGKVELRADEEASRALAAAHVEHKGAGPSDFDTEFLALVMSVRVVGSLDEAIDHIAQHGTHHTASIVTKDAASAERFLHAIDASCVLWNASTRFNDGGELGLGSEIGISTSKMHAFGPMGLRELTAEKFVVYGDGQVR